MARRNNIAVLFILACLLFSCGSGKRANAEKNEVFEKLQHRNGYLNGPELKKLDSDYALKLLDQFDFSGYDSEDTLAYFVRSGSYIWVASCYIGENDEDNPFFCLKQTPEKEFRLVQHGTIPAALGECSYDLDKLLSLAGNYILVSQKANGSGYCEDAPLVFTVDGKELSRGEDFRFILWHCEEDLEPVNCYERTFDYVFRDGFLSVHVKERVLNEESRLEVGTREYDLRYSREGDKLVFKDTLRKNP